MLFGLLVGLLTQIVVHGCITVEDHGGSGHLEPSTASAEHHRVIIVVPKEIKHIHHYKYIPAPKVHKHFHQHNEKVVVPQRQPPNRILHQYQPQPRDQYKQVGYETYEPQNYYNNNNHNHFKNNLQTQAAPLYEPQFPKVSPPSRQQIQNTFVSREPKLADRIKATPNTSPPKNFGKEAHYLNYGFKTPAHVKTVPVQKQKTKGYTPPSHFDEPYKFQDPFVNAFPQLQQAFNIHSNLQGHPSKEEFGSGGDYLTNTFQNYNSIQQTVPVSQANAEEPFDPYAHITHHPHGLVHVDLGKNIDGEIKQIEINNNGEFQAHLENDFDSDNDEEDDASEEEGGDEEGMDDTDDGFDDLLKEDNRKTLPYTGVMGDDRALSSIYPTGPMVFSHEHYDVTPRHPLQQHQVQPMQQSHLMTPSPTPAALQPLQPLYHRQQFLPIQHLQPPSQEEHSQFVPIQNFNYNTFKK